MEDALIQNFEAILKLLSISMSEKNKEINVRILESTSELQKELQLSELEAKLNGETERCQMLENKIFSMEKEICVLKNSQKNHESNESPSKRPRIDMDKNEPSMETDNISQELMAKYNVAMAELEELKRVSKNHVNELNSLQTENRKLIEDIESKKDQVRSIISFFVFFDFKI